MNYTTIKNNPWERHSVTYPWVYYDNAFNDDEIQRMCSFFDFCGVERGNILSRNEGSTTLENQPNENARKSNIKFHFMNDETAWIFDRLNFVATELNEKFYGFDLYGYDYIQYAEYDADELGKYDFHQDLVLGSDVPVKMQGSGIRKLSMVLLLNEPGVDFEGGQFELNIGEEKNCQVLPLKKGRILAFPSFMIHRVAPTTKGKRKSLVNWVLGPKFK